MTTPDQRRQRWEASVCHKIAHGLHEETDPAFRGWIEESIASEVSIQEVQRRYLGLLKSPDTTTKSHDVDMTALLQRLRQEIPELGEFPLQQAGERTNYARDRPCVGN
jgi:hypothetical protein